MEQTIPGSEDAATNSPSFLNGTAMETAIYSTPEPGTLFYVYYYGMFSIIASVNIPGNILVIRTVMRTPNLRQPCNFYIVSLAVTDLLIGFIYPVYNISHLEHVPEISRPLGKKFTIESPSLDFTMKLNVAIFIFKKICNEHLKKKYDSISGIFIRQISLSKTKTSCNDRWLQNTKFSIPVLNT